MVIWDAEQQKSMVIDYRERAPAAATPDMYSRLPGTDAQRQLASRQGPLAVAVPCNVAGLCYAVKEYGKLDLKTVMQPAILMARRGVPINDHMRSVQKSMLARMKQGKLDQKEFQPLIDEYLNHGDLREAGGRDSDPAGFKGYRAHHSQASYYQFRWISDSDNASPFQWRNRDY